MFPSSPTTSRKGQRFHLSVPVTIRIHKSSIPTRGRRKGAAFLGFTGTENISTRGCYFSLPWELPLGTHIELEITLPGDLLGVPETKLSCMGKVIRVDRSLVGGLVGIASTIDSHHLGTARQEEEEWQELLVVRGAGKNLAPPCRNR